MKKLVWLLLLSMVQLNASNRNSLTYSDSDDESSGIATNEAVNTSGLSIDTTFNEDEDSPTGIGYLNISPTYSVYEPTITPKKSQPTPTNIKSPLNAYTSPEKAVMYQKSYVTQTYERALLCCQKIQAQHPDKATLALANQIMIRIEGNKRIFLNQHPVFNDQAMSYPEGVKALAAATIKKLYEQLSRILIRLQIKHVRERAHIKAQDKHALKLSNLRK